MAFFIPKPMGFETKYLPIDQQQCGIPTDNKNMLYVLGELNGVIIFFKNLPPLKPFV